MSDYSKFVADMMADFDDVAGDDLKRAAKRLDRDKRKTTKDKPEVMSS